MSEYLPLLKRKRKPKQKTTEKQNKTKKLARRHKQPGATSEAILKEYIIKNCWVSDKGIDIITCLRTTKTVLKETKDPQMTST